MGQPKQLKNKKYILFSSIFLVHELVHAVSIIQQNMWQFTNAFPHSLNEDIPKNGDYYGKVIDCPKRRDTIKNVHLLLILMPL